MVYRFNNTAIDSENYIIWTNGSETPVEPKVFSLIVYLIEHADKVVSRDELLDQVWQGRVVSDTSINNSIKSARKVLGDDGTKQQIIKTIHSRGYQFVAELSTSGQPSQNAQIKPHGMTVNKPFLMLGTLLILLAVVFFISRQQPTSKDKSENSKIYSIAVLPFFNNIPDSATDYYGFAIADQVIGALNYLNHITVRPASSIRKYASIDFNPIEVGEELGVDYVLNGHYTIGNHGNIKTSNNDNSDIRLTTELVNIKTNEIVWRGKPILTHYNNTFMLQDMVAKQVVQGLKIEFATDKLDSIHQNIPQNPLAYEYYLRAIAYPFNTEGHRLAIEMVKQSIVLDDQYAPAYVELGNRTRRLAQFGLVENVPLPNTEQYYLKALSLNPELLDAMAHLSMLYTETNRIEEAMQMAQAMYQLNPNNANTHFTLGYIYRYAGLLAEAIAEMEKAVSLDPKNIKFRSLIGSYSATGQYQKALDMTANYEPSQFSHGWQALMNMNLGKTKLALQQFDYIINNYPKSLWAHVAIIHKAYLQGDASSGFEAVDSLVNTEVTDGETIYFTAAYYGLLGDKNRSIELLKKAVDNGYFNYLNIASNNYFDQFKSDPEFKLILAEAKRKHMSFRHKFFPNG